MRKRGISPFPVVSDAERYGCSFVPRFKSRDGIELESNSDLGFYQITDSVWSPTEPLTIEFFFGIGNPGLMFRGGDDIFPIAIFGSSIGMGIRCVCARAHEQRVCELPETITEDTSFVKSSFKLTLPAKSIYYGMSFELFLFVKSTRRETDRIDVYAEEKGSLLGTLATVDLVTGGAGGFFTTISEKRGKSKPLWEVDCGVRDEDDLSEEFTEDIFKLVINEDHPLYPQVVSDVGARGVNPIMFEIMADAFSVFLFDSVRAAPEDFAFEVSDDPDIVLVGDVLSAIKRNFFPDAEENIKWFKELGIGRLLHEMRVRLMSDKRVKLTSIAQKKGC